MHACRRVFEREACLQVSCGTTGEFSSLSVEERQRVTEIAAEEMGARGGNVIVHISACDVATCVQLARHAQRQCCAALLLLPPFYFHDATGETLWEMPAAGSEGVFVQPAIAKY